MLQNDVKLGTATHAFWQRKLIGSEDVLGRTINLNGAQFTVIGVAPAGFNGLWLESPVDVWIPLMMQAAAHYQQNFNSSNAQDDKPWPNQEGISWLDLIVRRRRSLPALIPIGAAVVVALTAALAAYIPAWRASQADATVALRDE